MMNHVRFEMIHRGQTSVAQKVYEAIPIAEAWSLSQINSELGRCGSSITYRVVEGCIKALVESGIVIETPLRSQHFTRTPVRSKTIKPKEKEPEMATNTLSLATPKAVQKPTGPIETMVEFVRNAPRLPDQDISNDPPAMLDQAQAQQEPLDRGEAVNLATNLLQEKPNRIVITDTRVRMLCNAIIAMDAELSRRYAAPVNCDKLIEASQKALEELEDVADLLGQFEAPLDSCVGASMTRANTTANKLREALEATK